MTVREAARQIGCGARHVRTLIQQGKLRARLVQLPWGGYTHDIPPREVRRFLSIPQTVGYPRGRPRNRGAK